MVADLKADTAAANFAIHYNQLWSNHLDSALQIPIDRLQDITLKTLSIIISYPIIVGFNSLAKMIIPSHN